MLKMLSTEVLMPKIDVDADTDAKLAFAGAVAGVSKAEIIARLVSAATPEMFAATLNPDTAASHSQDASGVAIYCDYEGHRTHALFDATTHRVDVVDGPLAAQSFKSPSAAACGVVAAANPRVSPNRNGWSFWRVERSGETLQTIR